MVRIEANIFFQRFYSVPFDFGAEREGETFWDGLLVGLHRGVDTFLLGLLDAHVAQKLLQTFHDVREGGPELWVHLEHMRNNPDNMEGAKVITRGTAGSQRGCQSISGDDRMMLAQRRAI